MWEAVVSTRNDWTRVPQSASNRPKPCEPFARLPAEELGGISALRLWPDLFPSRGLRIFSWILMSSSAKMSMASLARKCNCIAAKCHTHLLQASRSLAPCSVLGRERCKNKTEKGALPWGPQDGAGGADL